MQTELYSCLFCNEEFHPVHNTPRILDTCGHTFCSRCLREILDHGKCPFDSIHTPIRAQVEQIPVDSIIIATLPSLCQRHNKPDDLICLREYRRICSDCKEECLFQRHKIKALSDIEAEAETKKEALQALVDEFDSKFEEIDTLDNEEEALIGGVEKAFDLFKEAIEDTKNKVKGAVRKSFEEQNKISGEAFNHDVQLKKNAEESLEILNQNTLDQSFFKALYTHIRGLTITSQKPQIDAMKNTVDNHIEVIKGELMALLARIPTLLETKDHNIEDDFKVEESGDTSDISAPLLLYRNNSIEAIDAVQTSEQEQPRIEEEETTEDFQKAVSLFNAEIDEENRLILSFKIQREDMETEEEGLLSDQEKLKTISKVTLNINKSPLWKEAMESLKWIWNKLDKVLDFKVDFSYKAYAKEILKALIHQRKIWATTDLLEFTIDLSESQVKDKPVKQLYEKAISKMTHLKKLEIVLENTKITDKSIKDFAENTLPNLSNLTDFRFYVDNTKASDESIEKLLNSLHNRNKNLTGLAFGFDETNITDRTLKNIAASISPIASELVKLDLSAKNTNITDESLNILFENLNSHLNNLKEFTLDLGCTKISNDGFKFFAKNTLPTMASLEVFELFFHEQKQITNKTTKLIAQSLLPLTKLKKIVLELGGTDTKGKALDSFEKYALQNKPVLESFELYVAETKIKDVDINNFFMKIEKEQTFKNLKTLSFCFSKLHVTDDSCELLAKSIQACEHLQVLRLQLGKTKVTDTGLDHLSNGINQALQRTKMTEFQLYLDSTLVTDRGLKVLSNQVVRSLVGVKSFELYLTRVHGITDQGAETLFTDLATVAGSLRDIDINLHETKITDNCIKVLSDTLWNVKPSNLESLTLSLGKNKHITDNSLEWLLNNFGGILKNLKKFAIGIEDTKVSMKGLGLLKSYLNENSNALEKIEIEVGDDKILQRIVKDLQSLQIIVQDLQKSLLV